MSAFASTSNINGASRLFKRRRVNQETGEVDGSIGIAGYGSRTSLDPSVVPEVSIRTWDDDSIVTGSNRPPLVASERLQSTNLIVNSNQRVAGDPFSFTVNCGGSLQRGRMISLYRAIIPKIPNITLSNCDFQIFVGGGVGILQVVFPVGFYTATDICNELVYFLNLDAGGLDTFTCTFDPRSETFTLSSVGGNTILVDDTVSFQTRGANFFRFINPPGGPTSSVTSTKAGMLYTRYITVTSSRLDRYGVAPTLLSDNSVPSADIIAVIDVTKLYGPDDFNILVPFAGCFVEVDTPDAPFIRISNDSKELNLTGVDFTIADEYGIPLQVAFGETNVQGVVLMFEVYF